MRTIAQLQAELPALTVEWNLPPEADLAKLRTTFQPYWAAQKKAP